MTKDMTQAEFVQAVQVEMDLGEKSLSPSKIKAVLVAAGAVRPGLRWVQRVRRCVRLKHYYQLRSGPAAL
jgi:hypothetical protein